MILRGISRAAVQPINWSWTDWAGVAGPYGGTGYYGRGWNQEAYSNSTEVFRLHGIQSITIQANANSLVMGGSSHPYKVLTQTPTLRGQIQGAAFDILARRAILPEMTTQTMGSAQPQRSVITSSFFPSFSLAGVAQYMAGSIMQGKTSSSNGAGHIFHLYNVTLTDFSFAYADEKYLIVDASFEAVPSRDTLYLMEFFTHPQPAIAASPTMFGTIFSHPVAGTAPTTVNSFGSRAITSTARRIVATNDKRSSLTVYNSGPGTVYLGSWDVTPTPLGNTSSGGYAVEPGGHATVLPGEDGAEVWAVCPAGQSATLIFRET